MKDKKALKLGICIAVAALAVILAITLVIFLVNKEKNKSVGVQTEIDLGQGDATLDVFVGKGLKDSYYGPIKDSLFYMYDSDRHYIASFVTNEEGKAKVNGLTDGLYYVKQQTVQEGYILDDTIYTVTVTPENRNFYDYIYCDQELYGTFVIVVTDENGEPVPNATFHVTCTRENGDVEDVKDIKTNEKGQCGLTKLLYADYKIVQTGTSENLNVYEEEMNVKVDHTSVDAAKFFITNKAK